MNVLVKVVILLIFMTLVSGKAVRFDNFEPRRPIKYAFHLLELKAGIFHGINRIQSITLPDVFEW